MTSPLSLRAAPGQPTQPLLLALLALVLAFLALPAPALAQETLGDDEVTGANADARGASASGLSLGEELAAADDAEVRVYQVELARDLYQERDLMLQGLSAIETIWFTIPQGWEPTEDPELHVEFSHSAALLEYRSSLTVLVNEQAIGSVNLGADNVEGTELVAKIPLALLKDAAQQQYGDYHQLSFVVNQHYTDDCEDPFDPSLWTRVSRRSYIEFRYKDRQVDPKLSDFPYPMWDELGYGPMRLTLVQPSEASAATLQAAGELAFAFGRFAGWRRLVMEEPVARVGESTGPALIVGLLDEHPDLPTMVNTRDIGNNGLVAVVPHPRDPAIPVMVVTGKTPEALQRAAAAAVSHDRFQTLQGPRAVILEPLAETGPPITRQKPLPVYGMRTFTLQDINFDETTRRGFYAPEIRIPLRMQGDAKVRPGGGDAIIYYSYSAGLDVRLSTMEVRLNGVPLRSVRLDRIQGEQEARLSVSLPYEIMSPHSNLDVVFHLFPNDFGPCQRVSDRHLWATVFQRSEVTLPRDHYAEMPDLSLLQYRAFPYDLQNEERPVAIVLPDEPSPLDISAGMQVAGDLGRLTIAEDPDLTLTAAGMGELTQSQQILLVRETPHAGYAAIQGELVSTGDLENSLTDEGREVLNVRNSAPMSTIEQVLLDDKESTRLVVRAPNADDLYELSRSVFDDQWVKQLAGNLAAVSDSGVPRHLSVGETERMGRMSWITKLRLAFQENLWLFGLLAILLFIVAAILIRTWAAMRGGSSE